MTTDIEINRRIAAGPSIKGRDYQEIAPRSAFGALASGIPTPLPPDRNTPPTLSGRLMPVKLPDGKSYDLYWKDRADGKASFRWQSDKQRLLILAQPSEKNVAALFDAAAEKGIGMPLIAITGSAEFQRLAAQEAAKRGIPVDTSKLTDEAAREIYKQTFEQHHGEAANSIASAAYESADREEQRRTAELERQREKNAERGDDDERDRSPANHRMKG